jgi:transcription elongation factor Elf1
MNNNKQKNVKINKCSRCGSKTNFFIWTSSRQVNAGIRTMYPDDKICMKCYKNMCTVYPPVKREDNFKTCPLCGSKKWSRYKVDSRRGDFLLKAKKMQKVVYKNACNVCGYVEDVE